MADVTVWWAGPADATVDSVYNIEYTLDGSNWVSAAPNQAANTPYVSPSSGLREIASFGDDEIYLNSAASTFSTSGYGYLDDALIQWTGKSGSVMVGYALSGVTWHSGFGSYAVDSLVYEAHESFTETGLTLSNNAVLWRITHINGDGLAAQPAYLWYLEPPVAPANCCMVVTAVNSDLGIETRGGITVEARLEEDNNFALLGGLHLDSGQSTNKAQTTNDLGLAFHACWRSSAREAGGAGKGKYVFVLDSGSTEKLTVTVETIPDMPWVLLSQIITGVS